MITEMHRVPVGKIIVRDSQGRTLISAKKIMDFYTLLTMFSANLGLTVCGRWIPFLLATVNHHRLLRQSRLRRVHHRSPIGHRWWPPATLSLLPSMCAVVPSPFSTSPCYDRGWILVVAVAAWHIRSSSINQVGFRKSYHGEVEATNTSLYTRWWPAKTCLVTVIAYNECAMT
jgi:hypothetical protein